MSPGAEYIQKRSPALTAAAYSLQVKSGPFSVFIITVLLKLLYPLIGICHKA